MKIAISGGGIAGLTAALYLHRYGHEVYIYEKATGFRQQGYGLSVKTFGVEILKELELFEALKNKALPVMAFNICRSGGRAIRSIPAKVISEMTGGAVAVSRAALHEVLYEAAADVMPVIFDHQIRAIAHLPDRTAVTFNDGSSAEFDLLIVAEGLRSGSRQLLCGDQGWAPFDIAYVASTINQPHVFQPGNAYAYRGVGRNLSLFPVSDKQVVIQAYFRDKPKPGLPQESVRTLLQQTFAGFAPQVTQLLSRLDEHVFYDSVAMVQLPQLFQGRVAFIGDAAHSTTFLSGMGASLGMLDGKLLAECLETKDTGKALSRFNARMLPICRQFQHNARAAMKREMPQNLLQLSLTNNLMQLIPFSMMIKNVHAKLSVEDRLLAG